MAQPELYIIFNFIEECEPAPPHESVVAAFKATTDEVVHHKEFVEGIFMQNVDQTCKFKFMNYCLYDSDQHGSFCRDPEFFKLIRKHLGKTTASPGGYTEIATASDIPVPHLPKFNTNPNAGYFMTPISSEEGEQDDVHWLTWSGATYIKDNVPVVLRLRRITLHKRFTDFPPFNKFGYVLQVECDEILSNLDIAKDFLGRITSHIGRYTGIFKTAIHYQKPE